jgi:hypothetical protein
MRQLRRTNPDTKTAALETRVAALERRFVGVGHAWSLLQFTTDQAINGSVSIAWDSFWTNAPLTFWTNNNNSFTKQNTPGDKNLVFADYGVYVATCSIEWEPSATGYPHRVDIQEGGMTYGGNLAAFGAAAATASEGPYPAVAGDVLDTGDVSISVREWWDRLPTQTSNFSVVCNVPTGGPKNAIRGYLVVVQLANGQRELDYTVY